MRGTRAMHASSASYLSARTNGEADHELVARDAASLEVLQAAVRPHLRPTRPVAHERCSRMQPPPHASPAADSMML